MIRWRNGLPGGTTLQAKFSDPIRDCSSCSVADDLHSHLVRSSFKRATLSSGKEASIFSESRIMPRNSILVVGPSVFAFDSGMFKASKVRSMLDKLTSHENRGFFLLWGAPL